MKASEQYSPVAASSTGFPVAQWGVARSNTLETSEKDKRGMMGTSVEREQGVMGRESFSPSQPALH